MEATVLGPDNSTPPLFPIWIIVTFSSLARKSFASFPTVLTSGPPRHQELDSQRFLKLRCILSIVKEQIHPQTHLNLGAILVKHVGTILNTQRLFLLSPFPSPKQCCYATGSFKKNRNDRTTKLMETGYRYPEYKCSLATLFCYLSQNIMARIEGFVYLAPWCFGTVAFRVLPIKPRAPVFPLFSMKYVGASPSRRLDKLNTTPTQFN